MAYTTLADVKAYLGITPVGDDTLLAALIVRAQSIIEMITGRSFEAVTATKYFHAEDVDGQTLWMLGDDLLTVTTLTNGDGVVIAAANFRLEPRNSTPKFSIRLNESLVWDFTDGDSEITVAGTWGYAATAPAGIVQACIRLTSFLYRQKDTNADIDRPLVTGDGVTIMPSALPVDVMTLLKPYMRRFA